MNWLDWGLLAALSTLAGAVGVFVIWLLLNYWDWWQDLK